jgi:hypothetical protein
VGILDYFCNVFRGESLYDIMSEFILSDVLWRRRWLTDDGNADRCAWLRLWRPGLSGRSVIDVCADVVAHVKVRNVRRAWAHRKKEYADKD